MIERLNKVGLEIAKSFKYEGETVSAFIKYGSGRNFVTTNFIDDGQYELQVANGDWSCALRYSMDGKLQLVVTTGDKGLDRAYRINRRILEV